MDIIYVTKHNIKV